LPGQDALRRVLFYGYLGWVPVVFYDLFDDPPGVGSGRLPHIAVGLAVRRAEDPRYFVDQFLDGILLQGYLCLARWDSEGVLAEFGRETFWRIGSITDLSAHLITSADRARPCPGKAEFRTFLSF